MNKIASLVCIAALLALSSFLYFAGSAVGARDRQLFAAYDAERLQMVARACGKRGQLWQRPQSGEYVCAYTNPDGDTLLQPVSDAVLLAVAP